MCRLLLMTGLQNSELAERFMRQAKTPMSVGNQMGIGYTAVKSDGEFFTERWHDNDKFFDRATVRSAAIEEELKKYKQYLSTHTNIDQNYSLFGSPDMNDIRTVTMHTRYATCGREFANTHPFVDGDTSLVHNGVISNALRMGLNKISTCDSEAALQSYINLNVGKEINNAQAWIDTLEGYWAFGVLSRDTDNTRILDIIRNDAWLYYSEVKGLGTVMATTEDIIRTSANMLGLEYSKPKVIKDNKLFRFNAVTGELMSQTQLNDSTLNKRYSYGGYYGGYGNDYDYEKVTGKKKEQTVTTETTSLCQLPSLSHSKNESKNEDDPSQESTGFSGTREFKSIDDLFKFLDDDNEPLIDKLAAYDDCFDTNHTYQYECLPTTCRSEEWNVIDIEVAIDEIASVYNFMFGDAATGE